MSVLLPTNSISFLIRVSPGLSDKTGIEPVVPASCHRYDPYHTQSQIMMIC